MFRSPSCSLDTWLGWKHLVKWIWDVSKRFSFDNCCRNHRAALYLLSTPKSVHSSQFNSINFSWTHFPLDSLGKNRSKREIMSNKFDPWLFLSTWWSVSSRFSWVQRSRIETGLLESHWHRIYVLNEFMVALTGNPQAAWFERVCDVWSFHWKISSKPLPLRGVENKSFH